MSSQAMKWWNDLWLNEGFATYMENIETSYVKPDERIADHFNVDILQVALSKDHSGYSHSISVDVRRVGGEVRGARTNPVWRSIMKD